MYTSFDETKFKQAILEKDERYVKTCVINAIKNNPGFQKRNNAAYCEAWEAFEQLRREFPEVLTKYRLQPDEPVFDENDTSAWDKELFFDKCFWFDKNFCPERYNELFQIGRYLVKKQVFQQPQEQNNNEAMQTVQSSTRENFPKMPTPVKIALGLGAVVLVVLVVIFLAK